jgi:amidase
VAAVGTETDGSIVCPSGANANAGIKPTLGLLSRAGVIPISADQDTAGPMARNVTDAAVLLGAMTGVDPDDPATFEQAGNAFTDYTPFLDANALFGARVGVWREGSFEAGGVPVDANVSAVMDATIAALEAAGAIVVDPANVPFGGWANAEFPALLCEFKTDIAKYLETYTGPGYPKTLQDLIDFNNDHPELESGAPESNWNSLIFDIAQQTGGRDADCAALRAIATPGARAAVDALMAAQNLDAIIAPTNGPAWRTDPVNGDLGGDFSTFIGSSSPAAVAGYANVTVPAGFVGPLPVGVSFIGGRWDEPRLIGLAYAFEQATRVRVPPAFIPTIGGDASASRQSLLRGQQKASPEMRQTIVPGRSLWRMPPLR